MNPSLLEPLRRPLFRALWLASIGSNIGSHMHNTGAAWQMSLLSASPLLLGLVHVMANAPALLISPLAGAITDIADRRHLLLATQSVLFITALLLAGLTFTGHLAPASLLALTALMGLATAFNVNGWATVIQDAVPRHLLSPAVSLGSISLNTARSLGPALAGVLIAWHGSGLVFLLNALSIVGIIAVIARWREVRPPKALDTRQITAALREGFHYLRAHRYLRLLLLRHLLFVAAGAAVLALLPLLVKTRLGLEARGFGILSSCFGVGAIVASGTAHGLVARFGVRRCSRAGIGLSVVMILGTAFCHQAVLMGVLLLLIGYSWTFIALNHNVRVRMTSAPDYVGRMYSYYSICATGGMALGGLAFGWIADKTGLTTSLVAAAAVSFVALGLAFRHPMPSVHEAVSPED